MIDQLVEFYYKYDLFQESYMEESKIRRIYEILRDRNRLHIYSDNSGKLLGYGESARLSFEQLGKIVCGYNIYSDLENEDIMTGNIAMLMNVTIHPDWRRTNVLSVLRNDFFTANYSCDYFVGHAKRKRHQPWKVFSRQGAFKKWVNKPVLEGAA